MKTLTLIAGLVAATLSQTALADEFATTDNNTLVADAHAALAVNLILPELNFTQLVREQTQYQLTQDSQAVLGDALYAMNEDNRVVVKETARGE